MPLLFPLFVQRDLRRTHSACQQQPHPKRPSAAVTGAMDYEALLAWVRAHRVWPTFDPESEKSGQGWAETTEDPPNEWR